jgi:5'-methylthioinosine phosphorylase
MTVLAIIGGSGLTALSGLEVTRQQMQRTPYGEPSGPLTFGTLNGREIIFLPRHGNPHVIPPHRINYCANIWALKENNVINIIGVNAVGGITREMYPQRLAIPDQIIDYTCSRKHTYFEEDNRQVTHVDFTHPYCEELRDRLIRAGHSAKLDIYPGGTYGATQGPRLETAAEIARMERDGCDLVGMTGMPEAALARELGLCYATIAVIANRAAGKSEGPLTMEIIEENLRTGIEKACKLLEATIPAI